MTVQINQERLKKYDVLIAGGMSQREAAKKLGIPRATLQDWLRARHTLTTKQPAPAIIRPIYRTKVTRYIVSAAQDNTPVHAQFLRNLETYAHGIDAREILIAGFSYGKTSHALYEKTKLAPEAFDAPVRRYLTNRAFKLGDSLVFCGEQNTLPTAKMPLDGFETYTGEAWGIFPHAKLQMKAIATMREAPAKQLFTTGAVTQSNYIQRRSGILAHFHHEIAALVVEIDQDGHQWVRQLVAAPDGTFQDLDNVVNEDGILLKGRGCVEALTYGDLHEDQIDEDVYFSVFEKGGLADTLRPRFQFIHDAFDMKRRNHHSIDDPFFRIAQWGQDAESVRGEIESLGMRLEDMQRSYASNVIVESNHDLALKRWVRDADWAADPANAKILQQLRLAAVTAAECGEYGTWSPLEYAVRDLLGFHLPSTQFLREDEQFSICAGTIECGMHGHLGSGGARGSLRTFTRAGKRSNTAHAHSAAILEGAYRAGTMSRLDPAYLKGLSNWTQSHIVTLPNGKRQIVSHAADRNRKWRA